MIHNYRNFVIFEALMSRVPSIRLWKVWASFFLLYASCLEFSILQHCSRSSRFHSTLFVRRSLLFWFYWCCCGCSHSSCLLFCFPPTKESTTTTTTFEREKMQKFAAVFIFFCIHRKKDYMYTYTSRSVLWAITSHIKTTITIAICLISHKTRPMST